MQYYIVYERGGDYVDKNESVCDLMYNQVASELSFDHVFIDYKLGPCTSQFRRSL